MSDTLQPPPHLRGWFRKTRKARWVRLFLFEFFVVLLGVLAATGLQEHFQNRADERRATDAQDTLRDELGLLGYGTEARLRNYLCTVYRLGLMENRINGDDVTVGHYMFHPPDPALVTFPGWGSDTIGSMRRYMGEADLKNIAVVGELAEQLKAAQAAERAGWAAIHRISDDLGSPSQEDLSAAKGGLVEAKLALGDIVRLSTSIRSRVERLGGTIDAELLEENAASATLCTKLLAFTYEEQMAEAMETGRLLTGQKIKAFEGRNREDMAAAQAQ